MGLPWLLLFVFSNGCGDDFVDRGMRFQTRYVRVDSRRVGISPLDVAAHLGAEFAVPRELRRDQYARQNVVLAAERGELHLLLTFAGLREVVVEHAFRIGRYVEARR